MRIMSLLIGKTILKLLRLMGRSGSALPGLVIEKINSSFLRKIIGTLPGGVVIISGTNGKTTTTKVTVALLEAHGLHVLTNKTGSNFVRGTIAAVIDEASINGTLPYDIAVFELDEAHAVHFVEQVKPRGVVVLNIMRDQMDRFGEIDTTAKMLQTLVSSSQKWVVLNANDERVSTLQPSSTVKKIWYGHSKDLQHNFITDDELHHSDSTTYKVAAPMNVELLSFEQEQSVIKVNGTIYNAKSALAGSHNAINITAALAVVEAILPDADMSQSIKTLCNLKPAFGRGEVLSLQNGGKVTLQLVKNPGGFTHALGMLDLETYATAVIAINDDYADGRDVSWLWDVDFNRLDGSGTQIVCGGTRGNDIAVRLKYDGVTASIITTDLAKLVETVCNTSKENDKAIIYCTYTAMLKIRLLMKKYSKDIQGALV